MQQYQCLPTYTPPRCAPHTLSHLTHRIKMSGFTSINVFAPAGQAATTTTTTTEAERARLAAYAIHLPFLYSSLTRCSLMENTPPAVAALRRPTTTTSSDFWFCKQEDWENLIIDTKDPAKRRVAMNNLRKFDAAGRIMETDEGKAALSPCKWCTREGNEVACRVFAADGDSAACAFCKRMAKPHCLAGVAVVEDEAAASQRRVLQLENEVAALKDRVGQLEGSNTMLERRLEHLERVAAGQESVNRQIARDRDKLRGEFNDLWDHAFPI